MVGGADMTHGLLGLLSMPLFWSGVALIPFIATLMMVIRAGAAPANLLVAIIATHFAWRAASLFVAFGPPFAPALVGKHFICTQAATVFLFAELHMVGLRRTRTAVT